MGEITATCGHQVKPDEVKGVWWPESEIDHDLGEIVPSWTYGVLCPACLEARDDWREKSPWEENEASVRRERVK